MHIPPTGRFALALCLFAGWMGYLVYLAANKSDPVVLSRPQLLVSQIDVLAEVNDPDQPVVVKEVLFERGDGGNVEIGAKLSVINLRDCKRLPRAGEDPARVPRDWTGPGQYLLPLRRQSQGFAVMMIPPSPGFPPRDNSHSTPRIYPATEEVLRQYRAIREEP